MVEKYKLYASRLSKENLRMGYGGHYLSSEQHIYNLFADARKVATKII